MKKLFLCFFIFYFTISYSQNKAIDSLLIALKTAKEDTNKLNVTNKLILKFIYVTGNYDSSLLFAKKALTLSQNLKASTDKLIAKVGKKGEARTYINIGIAYLGKGNYPEALKNYSTALQLEKNLGDKQGIASSYLGLGIIYYKMGNCPEALKTNLTSLKIMEEIGDKRGMASSYQSIGNIYADLDNDSASLANFLSCLKIAKAIDDKINMAGSYNSIGNIYLYHGNYAEALKNHSTSFKIAKEINSKTNMAYALSGMGTDYLNLGNYSEALSNHLAGLKIEEEIGDKTGIARSFVLISIIYNKQKKITEAENYCLKGLSLAKEIDDLDCIKDANQTLSDINNNAGRFEKAFQYYKDFIVARDSMNNEEVSNKIIRNEMNYEFEKKQTAAKAEQDKKDAIAAEQNKVKELQLSRSRYITLALVAVLLLSFAISFIIFRQNKLRSQQRAMQLEQKLLRSQMNPHFIFNSLQAIQNFILKNETKEAVKFLSSFANVTRAVLENSINESILLKKEITLLEQYLQLQKLRYGNRFEYAINISPQIDPENIDIPPMLAQPFIENAIEHGMSKMETGGLITISFSKDYNNLFLEIKDNGIGIQYQTENKEHHSLATTITKERIALLNKGKTSKATFTISEAYPNETNKGVMVSFSIPLG